MLLKMISIIELVVIYMVGKTFGVSFIVRYLRNPNSIITPKILRLFGAQIGSGTSIKGSLFFDNVYQDQSSVGDFSNLVIGDNCYIGDSVYVDLASQVMLGESVVVSGRVSIITHRDCGRSCYLSKRFPRQCAPVKIQDGAWIGFDAVLMHGITIGNNAVVASRTLQFVDVEAETVYKGTPGQKAYRV